MRVYEHLCDEESRWVFNLRHLHAMHGDYDFFVNEILNRYDDWRPVEKEIENNRDRIIVFGCGHDGRITNKLLKAFGIEPLCYVDSYTDIRLLDGLSIYKLEDSIKLFPDAFYIIASRKYRDDISNLLIKHGICERKFFVPPHVLPRGTRGNQYFDVLEAKDNEVFVDCGAYDGNTTIEFINWTNKPYTAISLEPIKSQYEVAKKKLREYANVTVLNYAAWDKNEYISICENGASSTVDTEGTSRVEGIEIDSLIRGNGPLLIKMDIEGSELSALAGAKKAITETCADLAISIYHKKYDYIDIPSFILGLNPKYKIYMRHYSANPWETVLYATTC